MLDPEQPCARCERPTPHDALRVWTRVERLRTFKRRPVRVPELVTADADPVFPAQRGRWREPQARDGGGEPPHSLDEAPPAPFGYRWVTHAYVLCPHCHDTVEAGRGDVLDHDRVRALIVCAAVAGLVVLMWTGFAPFTHNWIAAFWRNGAGGR